MGQAHCRSRVAIAKVGVGIAQAVSSARTSGEAGGAVETTRLFLSRGRLYLEVTSYHLQHQTPAGHPVTKKARRCP